MPALLAFVFFFGAAIGSFLNVISWRMHRGESFVSGRSHCPHCRHVLGAFDLVPVFSYVFLRGRCRYCSKGLSAQYLAVEIAVGAAFVLTALAAAPLTFGGAAFLRLFSQWFFVAILALIFVYDLRYMLILPIVALPAAAIAFMANVALGMSPFALILGALIGGGFFYLQYAVSKGRWIGGGDIYLGVFMGAMLGTPKIFVALFAAYVVGALISSALIALRRKSMKSEVPFGTFLTFGAFIALLYGDRILAWYLRAL